MATKSFTRNIVITDKESIKKFKSAMSSESSTNLKSSIKDIRKKENDTRGRVVKSILSKY